MKSINQAMYRKRLFSTTTFQNVDKSSLFCLKNTIDDYENLESKDVIRDVFKQDLIFKAFSLQLQSVLKLFQEIDFFCCTNTFFNSKNFNETTQKWKRSKKFKIDIVTNSKNNQFNFESKMNFEEWNFMLK